MSTLGTRLVRLANWRALLALALVVGVLGMQAGRGTLAFFTSTATSTNNSFAAGTVVLEVADVNEPFGSSVTGSVGVASPPGMAPGDNPTGFIDVRNNGTLALRYALTTTDTTAAGANNIAVRNALTVGVDSRAVSTACTAAQGGAGQAQVVAAGTSLQTLAVGNPAQGAQAGDRTLAAGAGERLCFYVAFPSATGNSAQGGTASFTFNFSGEQTANNP